MAKSKRENEGKPPRGKGSKGGHEGAEAASKASADGSPAATEGVGQTPDAPKAAAKPKRRGRRALQVLAALLVVVGLLFVPEPAPSAPLPAEAAPYAWDQDEVWASLRARFEAARGRCDTLARTLPIRLYAIGQSLETLRVLRGPELAPDDPAWPALETAFFEAAADVAACPEHAEELISLQSRLRALIETTRIHWDVSERATRERLYRTLYGSRLAIEEVLLQLPPDEAPAVSHGQAPDTPSPCVTIHEVDVCSGDVLLSRGGAPTSALISRGSDFPGSFSHVALVHVAPGDDANDTSRFSTIEAHIEVGVVVAGLETYERDAKRRVLLLRPRTDLVVDPELTYGRAHAAAEHARNRALDGHVAYDFAMDQDDPTRMFCSEVASEAYASQGIELWKGLTTTSDPATARWLAAFGVRNFATHGPSDLEQDPNLVAVAEWRDLDTLFDNHLDDAVVDALLEGAASAGDEIGHDPWMLPVARLMKAWSWVKNRFGAVGPVPEGMSATVALRVQWLNARHAELRGRVERKVEQYRARTGHRPPYWELVRMANASRRLR
ncbi:MAG: hypothetical protein H6722_22510 [Sandaracinus sp.]|nr:hypothetical protein [Sandaracinus sp.]